MLKYHSLAISSTGVLFGHPVLEERERGREGCGLWAPTSSMGEVQHGVIHWSEFC